MSILLPTTTYIVAFLVALSALSPGLIDPKVPGRKSIRHHLRQDPEVTFKNLSAGSGRTEDGSPFSFWVAQASDGVKISARTEKRRTVSRAMAVFRRSLRGGNVLAEGPKVNSRGERVGKRAVAYFPLKDQNKHRHVVLWTDGSDFHYLESDSLTHLLAFEKKYYP